MELKETYITTQYRSTREGGAHATHRCQLEPVEIYAPSLKSGDWYLVRVMGVTSEGKHIELHTIIVKK